MPKPVTIGSRTFKSQTEAKAYLVKFLSERPHNKSFQCQGLIDLLRLHPNPEYHVDKAQFWVEHTPPNIHHLWVFYERDGEKKTHKVSWNKCLGVKKDTEKSLLRAAQRWAIRIQMRDWKNTQKQLCAICAYGAFLEVDHYPLAFEEIAANFNEKAPTRFADRSNGESVEFHFDDFAYECQWRDHHAAHAEYRLLCKPCHYAQKKAART